MLRSLLLAGTLPFALASLPVQADPQPAVPVLLGDLNAAPLSREPFPFKAPTSFLTVGERIVFSSSSGFPEYECVLWSYSLRTRAIRRLTSFPAAAESPCLLRGGLFGGYALYLSPYDVLWRTDGTPAGTSPLAALPVRVESGENAVITDEIGVARLLFKGCQGSDCGLWATDGTPSATRRLRGGRGDAIFRVSRFVPWHDRLYFFGESARTGYGLWGTDGTETGTVFLGPVSEREEMVPTSIATPSHLFFTSFGFEDEQLWASDGTPAGTRKVRAFYGERCGLFSCPQFLDALQVEGDEVVFRAHDGEHGIELWASDGSRGGSGAGTRRLTDLAEGFDLLSGGIRRTGGGWVFPVRQGDDLDPASTVTLWTTLGDPSTTSPLLGPECGEECPNLVHLFPHARQPEGRLYFVATEPVHGAELWVTDGTPAGTQRLGDVCPGPCSSFPAEDFVERASLVPQLGRFFFYPTPVAVDDPFEPRRETWSTDGTPGGTARIVDSASEDLVPFGERLLLGSSGGTPAALRLWTIDGTPDGTRLEATFLSSREESDGSNPKLYPARYGALFRTSEGRKQRLFRTDGTATGTVPIPGGEGDLDAYPIWTRGAPCGPWTYLVRELQGGEDELVEELWRSDASPESTLPIFRFPPGRSVDFDISTEWQGRCVFLVRDGEGNSFWVSDGSPGGTRELLRLPPSVSSPSALNGFGARFLYLASVWRSGTLAPQLFVSNGRKSGTHQLTSFQGQRGEEFFDQPLVRIGNRAYFLVSAIDSEDREIWATDGSLEGTHRVLPSARRPGDLVNFQGSLVFTDVSPNLSPSEITCGLRILRSQGGAGKPRLLTEMRWSPDRCPQFRPSTELVPAGDRLFFSGFDELGSELWSSDGTQAGTKRLRDFRPGRQSSFPDSVKAVGDRVYFAAHDGVHGRELWTSDGAPEGTRLIADLWPALRSSIALNSESQVTVSGGGVYFPADDGVHGVEPWFVAVETGTKAAPAPIRSDEP